MRSAPEYPLPALRQGLQGKALASFAVTAEGTLVEMGLRQSTGSELLDFHARRHIRRCIEKHHVPAHEPPLMPGVYAFPIEWRLD